MDQKYIIVPGFGTLKHTNTKDFADLKQHKEAKLDTQGPRRFVMEMQRSEEAPMPEITPVDYRKMSDQVLAHEPVTRVGFPDEMLPTFESESELRHQSYEQDDSSLVFGNSYERVDYELKENRRLNNRVVDWVWGQPEKTPWQRFLIRCCNHGDKLDRNIDIGWEDLAPKYKKYRIKYLWFRARCVYNMIRFVLSVHNNQNMKEQNREEEKG